MERDRYLFRLFKKAVKNFIRLKLLQEPENATIQDLWTKARQKLILNENCPVDDWSQDGFDEMNIEDTEKILNVIAKKSENQTSLETKLNALTEKFNTQQSRSNSGPNYQNNYQNQRSRYNYRGRYNNRGKNYKGKSHGKYGNNHPGKYCGQNSSNYKSNYHNYKNYSNASFTQNASNDETTVNSGIYDGHSETNAFSQKVCYTCGYPNYTARNFEVKGRNS